jgi:hypothetical protein
MANVFEALFALAVNVAVCAVVTDAMFAVKLAEVAPAGTATEAGTVTALLLLATFTANPPAAAAAFSVIVQLSVPEPVIEALLQERLLSTGLPVPLKLTTVDEPLEELLDSVNCPLSAPAVVGANCTVSEAVWPGFKVNGKVAPETEYPEPVTAAALTVTAELPVEDNVSVCVVDEPTATVPNETLELLTASVDVAAPN